MAMQNHLFINLGKNKLDKKLTHYENIAAAAVTIPH